MPEFPLAATERLIRKVGKVRVSRSAAIELNAILEAYGMELAQEAIELSKHRGAKTISEADIKVALKRI